MLSHYCILDELEQNAMQHMLFDRAPQSAPIAKKVHEDINRLLSREPGYRAATDTEFADLIWEGLFEGGPTVELPQCIQCQPDAQSEGCA